MYGFQDKNITPILAIALFTLYFGLGYPLLGIALRSFYQNERKTPFDGEVGRGYKRVQYFTENTSLW